MGHVNPQKNHIATCRGKATDLEDMSSVVLFNSHQILSAGPGTDMAPWLTFLGEVSYAFFKYDFIWTSSSSTPSFWIDGCIRLFCDLSNFIVNCHQESSATLQTMSPSSLPHTSSLLYKRQGWVSNLVMVSWCEAGSPRSRYWASQMIPWGESLLQTNYAWLATRP